MYPTAGTHSFPSLRKLAQAVQTLRGPVVGFLSKSTCLPVKTFFPLQNGISSTYFIKLLGRLNEMNNIECQACTGRSEILVVITNNCKIQ